MENPVLIVGAGPTGLVLALWLTRLDIPVRIIDKDNGPGETSRAMAVHARTLEFYQQMGFANEVVANGIIINQINLRKNRKPIAHIDLNFLSDELSPFPFVLSFPQDDHEKLLINHLQQLGVTVERNTELLTFKEEDNKIIATLKKSEKNIIVETPFILGCDGAKSTVRHCLNINFPGGTYSQLYYVADVMAKGDLVNHGIQVCFIKNAFHLAFPIRSSGSIRLIGIVPERAAQKEKIEFSDVKQDVIQNSNLIIEKVNWFSTYHSHHRVAEHFKKGRAFLLGDAGHIHSPAGGQGMNTGIGDAINLSWKIAAFLKNKAPLTLLDTYESERIAFAHRLIKTTDTLFQAITNKKLIGYLFRNFIFPVVFPFITRFVFVKKFFFKTVSQIKIHYRFSKLSKGKAGRIYAGDRLPWVHENNFDNFASLTAIDWQVHVYGIATNSFKQLVAGLNLQLHEFSWTTSAAKAGLQKDAVYLIRPDGYVGYANELQDGEDLKAYWYERRETI